MDSNQMSLLSAALQRAAATMRGGMQPPSYDMTGMFGPTPMASQGQPGLQPTPNAQVANRFPDMTTPNAQVANRFPQMDPAVLAKGDMQQMTPNQMVAQNFPPQMAAGVPMPQPRPTQAMMAAQAPGLNANGSITGAVGPTSVNGAPLVAQAQPQSAWDHYVKTGTGILPRTINLLSAFNSRS